MLQAFALLVTASENEVGQRRMHVQFDNTRSIDRPVLASPFAGRPVGAQPLRGLFFQLRLLSRAMLRAVCRVSTMGFVNHLESG